MTDPILDRVSYHAVYDSTIMDALRYAREFGFAGIQIADETPHLSFERLSQTDITEIARFSRSESIYITLHAPDDTASLLQCSRRLADGVIDYSQGLIAFARTTNARLITIHLGSMTEFPTDDITGRRIPKEDVALYSSALKSNVDSLLQIADSNPIVCVENYRIDLTVLDMVRPYLERGDLFLCWDLVKSHSTPEIEAFFLDHPEWIRQVHLHDLRVVPSGATKGHRVIGTGRIDFAKHLGFLIDRADVLDFCIEVRPKERARDSLLALTRIVSQIRR